MSLGLIDQAVPPKDIETVTLLVQAECDINNTINEILDRHLRKANRPPELGTGCELGIVSYIACTAAVGPPMRVVPVSIEATAEDPVPTGIDLP